MAQGLLGCTWPRSDLDFFMFGSGLSSRSFTPQALSARKVVGVEMVRQAVNDAAVNARLNGNKGSFGFP